jgi:hypothetical protein
MSGKGEYQSLVVFLGLSRGKKTTSSISGLVITGLTECLDLTFLRAFGTSGADATDRIGVLGTAFGGTSERSVNSLDSESDEVTIVGMSACGSRHDHSVIEALALFGSKASPLSSLGGGLRSVSESWP